MYIVQEAPGMSKEDQKHVYVIKKRLTIDLKGVPFEYEELVGKCTDCREAERYLAADPAAYIAEDAVYTLDDLSPYVH